MREARNLTTGNHLQFNCVKSYIPYTKAKNSRLPETHGGWQRLTETRRDSRRLADFQ